MEFFAAALRFFYGDNAGKISWLLHFGDFNCNVTFTQRLFKAIHVNFSPSKRASISMRC